MLRCGTAFGEILLLGRKMDELAGYTHRIMQLFRALQVLPPPRPFPSASLPLDLLKHYMSRVSSRIVPF